MVGGETAAQLLQRLRVHDELRDQLREAEAIFVDIPLGQIDRRCSVNQVEPEQSAPCMAAELATHREHASAIMGKIIGLRTPDEAIICVGDTWQFAQPQMQALGVYEEITEQWQCSNRAVAAAAARPRHPRRGRL